MNNRKQHPTDVQHESHPADTDRKPVVSVRGRAVVYDPDPHAHLTPTERYALAIQRRDAVVAAKRRSSEKSQTVVSASEADERRNVGTECGDIEESYT